MIPALLLAGIARRHLPSRHLRHMAVASEETDRLRLERHLDAVDLSAPPRVELTYGPDDVHKSAESVGVLDSSFNPPTRAHMHLLTCAARRFGCAARRRSGRLQFAVRLVPPGPELGCRPRRRMKTTLLLLAKQNADKPVVGASLVQRLQMMELLARADVNPEGFTPPVL